MKNPLISLDELVWQGYEKITVKANKELNWNKYDLARLTCDISKVLCFSAGCYYAFNGVINNDHSYTFFGGGKYITYLFNTKK